MFLIKFSYWIIAIILRTVLGTAEISYKVEAIPNSFASIGEGPHWDIATQSLYYVDITIEKGILLRYDYNTNKVHKCELEGGKYFSFVIPIEGYRNMFAVGSGLDIVIIEWDGISPICKRGRNIFVVLPDLKKPGLRFNDGKCDSRGRLFAGTMRAEGDQFDNRRGNLYSYDREVVRIVKSNVSISNGLTWNEKTNKFYYIDTVDFEVKEYDYDIETGLATHPRVILDLRKDNELNHLWPDGMTIDSDGNIYVAIVNGYSLYKVCPRTGKILLVIKLKCKQVTSAAFGGPNLDILFVTTAARYGEPAPAGTTFKITGLGVTGLPMTKMALY